MRSPVLAVDHIDAGLFRAGWHHVVETRAVVTSFDANNSSIAVASNALATPTRGQPCPAGPVAAVCSPVRTGHELSRAAQTAEIDRRHTCSPVIASRLSSGTALLLGSGDCMIDAVDSHDPRTNHNIRFGTQAAEELVRGQQQGWRANAAAYEGMIDAVARVGDLDTAFDILNRMKVRQQPNIVV